MSRGHERRSMAVPVKVGVYTVTMLLILAALIVVFGDFRNTKTTGYSALFADASGLAEGQNVRAAGVPVGKVTAVTLRSDASVKVSFSVATARPPRHPHRVAIKYENLTGDRYLEISPGTTGPARRLAAGAMIPRTRTPRPRYRFPRRRLQTAVPVDRRRRHRRSHLIAHRRPAGAG